MDQIAALGLEYSHPSFIVKTLLENTSLNEAKSLMRSNNEPRSYYFRINKLIADPGEVSVGLQELGVAFEADSEVPLLYKVQDGVDALFSSKYFRDGEILVQDRSSVLVARALSPEPGSKVWDACAAPGMKTHALWEMMEQRGTLCATDIHPKRLQNARKRAKTLGLDDVKFIVGDAIEAPVESADRILIDAPCSSTGILRSHPSYKWMLNRKKLFSIMAIQNKLLEGILAKYQDRPGTEIVFATCSILPHEGESQIDSILSKYPIELLEIPFKGSPGYSKFDCSEKVLRLFPNKHDSSGFFISRFRITS
jgi:16S rRNA (cytosine967-C5)-methyltransferase